MPTPRLLIVWSHYYTDLAERQLTICLDKLKSYPYLCEVEKVEAGTYEIPAVIQHYESFKPFDGYLPLSLLLKGQTDHYEFIWQHIQACFIQFSLRGVIFGNGVIAAKNWELLESRVEKGERVQEAIDAVHYLLSLKKLS